MNSEEWQAKPWNESTECTEVYCGDIRIVDDLLEEEAVAIVTAHNASVGRLRAEVAELRAEVGAAADGFGENCIPSSHGHY